MRVSFSVILALSSFDFSLEAADISEADSVPSRELKKLFFSPFVADAMSVTLPVFPFV